MLQSTPQAQMATDYVLKCSLGLDGPVFDVDDDDMNSSVAVAFTDDQYTGSSATLHLLLVVLLRSCCCFHGKIICADLICRWFKCKYKCEYLYTKITILIVMEVKT